jgi:hypothetical protein
VRWIALNSADRKLIAGVLLIALLGFAGNHVLAAKQMDKGSQAQAIIKAEGKVIRTIALHEKAAGSFLITGKIGPERVEIAGKRVRIVQSPCPNQLCVQQGWISTPGQSIVCVPGRILIYIEGKSAVDAILR